MLHNLNLLSTDELLGLFIKEGHRFLDESDKAAPRNTLRDIHHNLKAIISELDNKKMSKDSFAAS